MISMKNILDLFGKRDVEIILEETRNQIDHALSVMQELRGAMDAFVKGDCANIRASVARAVEIEEEADEMRRAISDQLVAGQMVPIDSQDYLRLIFQIDVVADLGKTAAQILELRRIDVPPDLGEDLISMTEAVIQTVERSREAAFQLRPDLLQALKIAQEAELCEERVDDLHFAIKRKILNMNLELADFIQLYELITVLENTADAAEDVADQIRLLAVKYVK